MPGALNWLMDMLHRPANPIVGSDGTTYGPAESRITHTPITFTTSAMPESQMGQYVPPGGLLSVLGLIPQLHRSGEGQILVNPTSSSYGTPGFPANVGAAVRHESAHAAFDKLGYQQKSAIANTPGYNNLEPKISEIATGDPRMEVGAYAATQPPGSIPTVPASDQTSYLDHLINTVSGINPAVAKQLARLRTQ